jgi:hypothetical protein
VGIEVLPVDRVEGLGGAALAAEQLDHPHPGELLLQVAVEPGQPEADVAEGAADLAPEQRHRQHHERNHHEGDQRQPPLGHQHHDHDGRQREHVAEHRDQAGGEDLVQGLHVGSDPGHQAAHRVHVEERDAEPLEPDEELAPEVGHHPLADPAGQEGLPVLAAEFEHGRRDIERGKGGEQAGVMMGDGDVEGLPGERRRHQGQAGQPDQEENRRGRGPAVGPEVPEKPPGQRRVVGPLERLLGGRAAHSPVLTTRASGWSSTPLSRWWSQR